jgi:hypothetical protein
MSFIWIIIKFKFKHILLFNNKQQETFEEVNRRTDFKLLFSNNPSVSPGRLQGSVLEPSLFIYYINDLQNRLRSTVRLFADNTIAYRYLRWTLLPFVVHSPASWCLSDDEDPIQGWHTPQVDGLGSYMLAPWSIYPAKCTVLTVTNKLNPIVTEYTIRGQLLAAVTSAKYLGVTITDKVNWSQSPFSYPLMISNQGVGSWQWR